MSHRNQVPLLAALACVLLCSRFVAAQDVSAQCTGAFATSWGPTGNLETSSKTLLRSIENGRGTEMLAGTPVPFSTLTPFLPPGYAPETAATTQPIPGYGFLFVANLRYASSSLNSGEIRASYVMIQIQAPAWADQQGLNSPGTFHFYVLKSYTSNKAFQDVLVDAGFPMDFRGDLDFSASDTARNVSVPGAFRVSGAAFFTNTLPSGVSVVIWSQGGKGTSVVQVLNTPAVLGTGAATVLSPPGSCLSSLLKTTFPIFDCAGAPRSDAPGWSCTGPVVGLANDFPGSNNLKVWQLQGN
ncbi:hypothetical protein HXX76_006283 [Chlamydomonas incerta]|uniref:Uncharacterized protein n=1 Tax=Chlamydomonas incerta TaxID=51695 RepID=A0A835TAH4_CHLIN|nr:hypothetical protein HXX76_006283 [Chlamydomonas incerta]|eukprot:KAG2436759.1 hypothetical protein HXX76_006283 [Chlamydomonas incerta]